MVKCRSEKQPILKNRKYYHIGYSIAATVALFIVGFWIVNNVSSSYINISAPVDDKLAITLPDSSEVWLNAASQIRYHKSFLNNREIFLEKGERLCQNAGTTFFYAQSPDFPKPGLCYYLIFL